MINDKRGLNRNKCTRTKAILHLPGRNQGAILRENLLLSQLGGYKAKKLGVEIGQERWIIKST